MESYGRSPLSSIVALRDLPLFFVNDVFDNGSGRAAETLQECWDDLCGMCTDDAISACMAVAQEEQLMDLLPMTLSVLGDSCNLMIVQLSNPDHSHASLQRDCLKAYRMADDVAKCLVIVSAIMQLLARHGNDIMLLRGFLTGTDELVLPMGIAQHLCDPLMSCQGLPRILMALQHWVELVTHLKTTADQVQKSCNGDDKDSCRQADELVSGSAMLTQTTREVEDIVLCTFSSLSDFSKSFMDGKEATMDDDQFMHVLSKQPILINFGRTILRIALRSGRLPLSGQTSGSGGDTKGFTRYILSRRSAHLFDLIMPRHRTEICEQALVAILFTLPIYRDGCELPLIVAILGLLLKLADQHGKCFSHQDIALLMLELGLGLDPSSMHTSSMQNDWDEGVADEQMKCQALERVSKVLPLLVDCLHTAQLIDQNVYDGGNLHKMLDIHGLVHLVIDDIQLRNGNGAVPLVFRHQGYRHIQGNQHIVAWLALAAIMQFCLEVHKCCFGDAFQLLESKVQGPMLAGSNALLRAIQPEAGPRSPLALYVMQSSAGLLKFIGCGLEECHKMVLFWSTNGHHMDPQIYHLFQLLQYISINIILESSAHDWCNLSSRTLPVHPLLQVVRASFQASFLQNDSLPKRRALILANDSAKSLHCDKVQRLAFIIVRLSSLRPTSRRRSHLPHTDPQVAIWAARALTMLSMLVQPLSSMVVSELQESSQAAAAAVFALLNSKAAVEGTTGDPREAACYSKVTEMINENCLRTTAWVVRSAKVAVPALMALTSTWREAVLDLCGFAWTVPRPSEDSAATSIILGTSPTDADADKTGDGGWDDGQVKATIHAGAGRAVAALAAMWLGGVEDLMLSAGSSCSALAKKAGQITEAIPILRAEVVRCEGLSREAGKMGVQAAARAQLSTAHLKKLSILLHEELLRSEIGVSRLLKELSPMLTATVNSLDSLCELGLSVVSTLTAELDRHLSGGGLEGMQDWGTEVRRGRERESENVTVDRDWPPQKGGGLEEAGSRGMGGGPTEAVQCALYLLETSRWIEKILLSSAVNAVLCVSSTAMATPCCLDIEALDLSLGCIMPGKYIWAYYGEAVIVLVQRLLKHLAKVAHGLSNLSCWQEHFGGLDRAATASEEAAILMCAHMCGPAKTLRTVALKGIEGSYMAKLMPHQDQMRTGKPSNEPWDVIAAAAGSSPDAREAAGAISRLMPEALSSLGAIASGIGFAAEEVARSLAPFLFPSEDDDGSARMHDGGGSASEQPAVVSNPEPGHHDSDSDRVTNLGNKKRLRLMSLRSVLRASREDWGLAASLALGPSSCPLACLNPRCSSIAAAAAAASEAVKLDLGLGSWHHCGNNGPGDGHSCQGCGFLHCCGEEQCFRDAKERCIHMDSVCLALKRLEGTVGDHCLAFDEDC